MGGSGLLEESQVESSKHQNDADVRDQPFPESVSKEREIYADDDGYHRYHIKNRSYPRAHLSKTSFHFVANAVQFALTCTSAKNVAGKRPQAADGLH